jgi:hypothetical protein
MYLVDIIRDQNVSKYFTANTGIMRPPKGEEKEPIERCSIQN